MEETPADAEVMDQLVLAHAAYLATVQFRRDEVPDQVRQQLERLSFTVEIAHQQSSLLACSPINPSLGVTSAAFAPTLLASAIHLISATPKQISLLKNGARTASHGKRGLEPR